MTAVRPLRVLVVEDVEADAELVLRELKRGGFGVTSQRVETAEQLRQALDGERWDLVISDFSLPAFSAPAALEMVKARKPELPFIIVSGTVGEDIAVDSIRAGAHDFMAKGKFARLIPAVERELRDAALRAEAVRMQEQLLISDRMASMGTLAAGVAHEINNPLTSVMLNLELLGQDLSKLGDDARDDPQAAWVVGRLAALDQPIADAREAADRVRHIVRDLKIFSRSDEESRGAVDVHAVLESCVRMAWNEIRHRARLVKRFAAVPMVEGNEARLGQVFLNLIVNAAQALPEGRTDQNEIAISTASDAQGQVVVEVADTGSGIPEELRARIFDPFFTTKPVGVGTGLGLAICHRIVTALGGCITVESRPGEGSKFRISLPPAREDEARSASPVRAPGASRRGKVLVIDDEPMLGKALKRMLAPEHEVAVLTSGAEALERLRAGERPDVILCDLMMPELSGPDVYAEVVKCAPEVAARMVFMTGGAFTGRARDFLDQVTNHRIDKPFDAGALRALVASLLR